MQCPQFRSCCSSSKRLACVLVALCAGLAGCGGGSAAGDGGAPITAAAAAAPAPTASATGRGTPLGAAWSAYPRLLRLAHQADNRNNGRLVASLTERVDGAWQAGFFASVDGGGSFTRSGQLKDSAFAAGLCCGTLFEVPQTVGTLPAGTLLYAASVGADQAGVRMEHPIYRSDDAGASFRRIEGAACGRSDVPRGVDASGIWEPEFLVAADGSLACIYSDETEPNRSQVLKITTSSDGSAWSAPRSIVTGAAPGDRPGMASVRRLPSGHYAMGFELCSTQHADCSVHVKVSKDGLDWGAPASTGVRAQTADGRYFLHAPTLAWAPVAGSAAGQLVLVGQQVASDAGGIDTGASGRLLFVNTDFEAGGPWRSVPAPIGLARAPAVAGWCDNYSTPLLPSADGSAITLVQTDRTADGGCSARFGSGSLGGG